MKKRFTIAFALLFAAFSAGIGTTIALLWHSSQELSRVVQGHQVEELRQILSLRLHLSEQDLQVSGTVFANNLDDIVANVEALDASIQGCFGCHHEPALDLQLQDAARKVELFKSQFSRYITAFLNEEQRQSLQLEAAATANELGSVIDDMMISATPRLQARTNHAMQEVERSWRILVVTLALSFVGAGLVAAFLVRSITAPVDRLVKATARISTGDLGYLIDHREKHELGSLMDSFNEMSTTLQCQRSRLDGYVARLRRLIRAVFSLRTTPDAESMRPRLVEAMEELIEAEIYGVLLKTELEDTFVLSLRRAGEHEPFYRGGISGGRLEKIRDEGTSSCLIGTREAGPSWPFGGFEPDEPHNFLVCWIDVLGDLRGALIAVDRAEGEFVDEDVELLSALGYGVAEALENIKMYQEVYLQTTR